MKNKKHHFLSSTIFNTIKYGLIFALFYINKHYYYNLNIPFFITDIPLLLIILCFTLIISTIYLYILKKSSNYSLTISYYLISVLVILYVILLIDLELMLASLVNIIYITYLYIENLLECFRTNIICKILSTFFIVISIYYTILNFCIVLFNM